MSRNKTILLLLAITAVLIFSCCSCDDKKGEKELPKEYTVLEVQSRINSLRATETSWERGDQIGLYAVVSGKGLSSTSIFQKASNLPYTTPDGDGQFLPAEGGEIRLMPEERIDLISYYPYQPVGADHKLRINVRDQSDLSKLDLLYSDNARGLNNLHPKANLQFDHAMSQLQVSIMGDGATDLNALQISVGDVKVEGVFDLTTGQLSNLGAATSKITMHKAKSVAKGATHQAILLPGQELKGLTYTFEVAGKSYTYTEMESKKLQAGIRVRRNFKLTDTGVELIDATIEIIGEGEGGTQPQPNPQPDPEQPGEDPKPEPPTPPAEGYGNQAYYMEQVLIQNGYMEDRVIHQEDTPDSFFAGGTTPGGKRRNYTIYFSKNNHQPYMVAYPMYRDCLGEWSRKKWGGDPWDFGPGVEQKYQMQLIRRSFQPREYNMSRGHMLASNQRTASKELNRTTFYFTNVVPQEQSQNAGIWATLENKENAFAKNARKTDTLYVVCGPTLAPNAEMVRDDVNKKCPIPTHTWKVLLKKKKGQWVSIGVKMPNVRPASGSKWDDYTCTVAELEKELGVKFFPSLPENEATAIKSQNNSKDW